MTTIENPNALNEENGNRKFRILGSNVLARVTGGTYNGEKKCPACGQDAMQYMPSILTPEGVSYKVYHCQSCGHDEYIKE